MDFEIKAGRPEDVDTYIRWPWNDVQIGQYFSVPRGGRAGQAVPSAVNQRNRKNPGEKWVTRTVGETIRVYRVDPDVTSHA